MLDFMGPQSNLGALERSFPAQAQSRFGCVLLLRSSNFLIALTRSATASVNLILNRQSPLLLQKYFFGTLVLSHAEWLRHEHVVTEHPASYLALRTLDADRAGEKSMGNG